MTVHPLHRYSNEVEIANQEIYDFQIEKKSLVCMFFTNIFQRFKG